MYVCKVILQACKVCLYVCKGIFAGMLCLLASLQSHFVSLRRPLCKPAKRTNKLANSFCKPAKSASKQAVRLCKPAKPHSKPAKPLRTHAKPIRRHAKLLNFYGKRQPKPTQTPVFAASNNKSRPAFNRTAFHIGTGETPQSQQHHLSASQIIRFPNRVRLCSGYTGGDYEFDSSRRRYSSLTTL